MARETCLPDIQDAQLTQVKNMARVQPPPAEETAADVKETGSDVWTNKEKTERVGYMSKDVGTIAFWTGSVTNLIFRNTKTFTHY